MEAKELVKLSSYVSAKTIFTVDGFTIESTAHKGTLSNGATWKPFRVTHDFFRADMHCNTPEEVEKVIAEMRKLIKAHKKQEAKLKKSQAKLDHFAMGTPYLDGFIREYKEDFPG